MTDRTSAAIVTALWAAWAAPVAPWLVRGWLASPDGLAQAGVAAAALVVAARDAEWRPGPPSALAVAFVAAGTLLPRVAPGSEAVHAAAVTLAGYGVLGWWLARARWRALFALPWLLWTTLPVLPLVDAAIGWPLRKMAAQLAASALGGIATETVIAVEGSVARVDAPCAGLHGAWALVALALLASMARGAGLGARTLAAIAAGVGVGWIGNVARVVAIVGLAHGLGAPLLADTVHAPLGVAAFAAGLAVTWLALPPAGPPSASTLAGGRSWVTPLAATCLVAAFALPPRAAPVLPPVVGPLPAGWSARAPSAAEEAFAAQHGSVIREGTLAGAAVALVSSRSWAAHHVPTWCLAGEGWVLGAEELVELDGHGARRVRVARDGVTATLWFWFAADGLTTDDLTVRIRDGARTGRTWTLITVLVPDGVDPRPVFDALRGA